MTGSDELIISVDLGTSNIKGAVFDIDGKQVAFGSIEYTLYTPSENIVESDVEIYWDNIIRIIINLCKNIGQSVKNVRAIVTSSQAETIVPVDSNMNPLRNAIVWIDMRSKKEAREISSNFDIRQLYKKTGYPEVDPSWPATRVLWIKKNEPAIFEKTYKFLLLHDYVIYRLSGEIAGEATTYNSSYYYDIMDLEYIDMMLDFIGISKKKLPEVFLPGTMIGKITDEIAEKTGLKKDTCVIAGAMDQVCGAVGAGNISEGIATETTGSAFAMVITTKKPVIDYDHRLPCILHAVPGLYGLMPYSSTGGMVLKWFKDRFCLQEETDSRNLKKNVFQILDEIAESVPAGSEGLVMLPYLTGALFPEYDPKAKGVFFGIGINHHKGHFIRAILESLGYMMRNDIDAIRGLGINLERIISIGGGASSRLWSQIKSDICKIRIDVPQNTETALLGAAMIAEVSLGLYDSLESAGKNILKIKDTFLPNKDNFKTYDSGFNRYRDLYKNLKDMF